MVFLFVGEPVPLSGWYKYTPGPVYYDNKNQIVSDKVDECSIYAVLYMRKLLDKDGNNIVLTGDYKDKEAYIGTSSRVVMRAALENGGRGKRLD